MLAVLENSFKFPSTQSTKVFFCPIFHVCICYNLLLIDRERALYKVSNTAWKVSEYGVFSGPYLSVFSPNAGKHGLEKTPYFWTLFTQWNLLGLCMLLILIRLFLLTLEMLYRPINMLNIFLDTIISVLLL